MPTKQNTFKRKRSRRVTEDSIDGKEDNSTHKKCTLSNESLPALTSVIHDALHSCVRIEKPQKANYLVEASITESYNTLNNCYASTSSNHLQYNDDYDDDMESVYSDFDLVNDLMQEVFFESSNSYDDDEYDNRSNYKSIRRRKNRENGDSYGFNDFESNKRLHNSDGLQLLPKKAASNKHTKKQANSQVYVGEIFDLELKPEMFEVKPLITTKNIQTKNVKSRVPTVSMGETRAETCKDNNNTKGDTLRLYKKEEENHRSETLTRKCKRKRTRENNTEMHNEPSKSISTEKVANRKHNALLSGNTYDENGNNDNNDNSNKLTCNQAYKAKTTELFPSSAHSECASVARCREEEDCVTSVDGRHRRKNAQFTRFLRAVHGNDFALTVVLDVDETLVYARDRCIHVRPHVERFIHTCRRLNCELVVWTAAKPSHINPILQSISSLCKCSDWFAHIISRHRKWFTDDSNAVKDLRLLGRREEHVLVIENNPLSVIYQPNNVVLVEDYLQPNDKDMTMNELCTVVQRVVELTSTQPQNVAVCHKSNRQCHVSETSDNYKHLPYHNNKKLKYRTSKVVSTKKDSDACSLNFDSKYTSSNQRHRDAKMPPSSSALSTKACASLSVPDALTTLDCLTSCTFELQGTHMRQSYERVTTNASTTLTCHVLRYSPNANFLQRSYGLMQPLDFHPQ